MKTQISKLKGQNLNTRIYKSVLAVTDDGTVQLTITIPRKVVESVREESLNHLISELEVAGFRKGRVSREIALKHIDAERLREHMIRHILPDAYGAAIKEHSIRPILLPKFELVKTEVETDWVVRATTCQLPEVELGDYKQMVSGIARKKEIWVPGKEGKNASNGEQKGVGKDKVVEEIVKLILEKVKIAIPKLLIDEEVNHRLAKLLDQVQKLGLTVEQYLTSTGKSVTQLKNEYAKQAEDNIKIELSLNKVARQENLEVSQEEVNSVLAAADNAVGKTGEGVDPQQKSYVMTAILRRKALDILVSFA